MKVPERALEIAQAFATDVLSQAKLAEAIQSLIEEAQRDCQSWRPIEMRSSKGGPATISLHCTQEGTEIHAFNPIRGDTAILRFEVPVVRKSVGSETSSEKRKAARA